MVEHLAVNERVLGSNPSRGAVYKLLDVCYLIIMKTLKCDMCDYQAKGNTFEEWMNTLKPHYGEVHADQMKQMAEMSKEEQMAGMQKWMADNKARFDAQPENK